MKYPMTGQFTQVIQVDIVTGFQIQKRRKLTVGEHFVKSFFFLI